MPWWLAGLRSLCPCSTSAKAISRSIEPPGRCAVQPEPDLTFPGWQLIVLWLIWLLRLSAQLLCLIGCLMLICFGLCVQVMYRLDGVDAEVKSYFGPVARMLLSQRDPQEALEVGGWGGLGCNVLEG